MIDLIFAIAFSQHIGMQGEYNAIHPHIQLQADSGFVAGAYLNSESNVSPYVGWRFEYEAAFLELGAVAGYNYIDVAPYLRAGYEIAEGFDLFAAPAFETDERGKMNYGAVVGISFNF